MMDLIVEGIAFAALVIGQFVAVVAVHAESKTPRVMREAPPADFRTGLIWEGGGS